MRVSACGWAAGSLEEALDLARRVTMVTHDHPEGLKGAAAVAAGIRLGLQGASLEEIRSHLHANYYRLDFTVEAIRRDYRFSSSCQGSVPQALEAFLESSSLEQAVRLAVSLGGDSDTQAAIAGSLAEAKFGAPAELRTRVLAYLDEDLKSILRDFEAIYPPLASPPLAAPAS
jgi:type I restriction enzyme M protein